MENLCFLFREAVEQDAVCFLVFFFPYLKIMLLEDLHFSECSLQSRGCESIACIERHRARRDLAEQRVFEM